MADRITITPEELRSSSSTFASKAEEVKTILDTLSTEVDNLSESWAGAAQSQFFEAYEEMKETLNQFPNVLEGISKQLKVVADTLEETDASLRDALAGN